MKIENIVKKMNSAKYTIYHIIAIAPQPFISFNRFFSFHSLSTPNSFIDNVHTDPPVHMQQNQYTIQNVFYWRWTNERTKKNNKQPPQYDYFCIFSLYLPFRLSCLLFLRFTLSNNCRHTRSFIESHQVSSFDSINATNSLFTAVRFNFFFSVSVLFCSVQFISV